MYSEQAREKEFSEKQQGKARGRKTSEMGVRHFTLLVLFQSTLPNTKLSHSSVPLTLSLQTFTDSGVSLPLKRLRHSCPILTNSQAYNSSPRPCSLRVNARSIAESIPRPVVNMDANTSEKKVWFLTVEK